LDDFVLPDAPEFNRWQHDQAEALRQEMTQAPGRIIGQPAFQAWLEEAVPLSAVGWRWTRCASRRRNYCSASVWPRGKRPRPRHYDLFSRQMAAELGVPPGLTLKLLQAEEPGVFQAGEPDAERPFTAAVPESPLRLPSPPPPCGTIRPTLLWRRLASWCRFPRRCRDRKARCRYNHSRP
jgi:hypothetical protein